MITGLLNGNWVTGGGRVNINGKDIYSDTLYIFSMNGASAKSVIRLDQKVADAGAGYFKDQLVYAGGENESGLLKSVRLLSLSGGRAQAGSIILPDLPEAVKHPGVLISGNRLYVAGGEGAHGNINSFVSLDLGDIKKGWVSMASLPYDISFPEIFIQSNGETPAIYLAGLSQTGNGSKGYLAIGMYDEKKNAWGFKSTDSVVFPFSTVSAIAVGSTYAVLTSNLLNDGFYQDTGRLYLFNTITNRLSVMDTLPVGRAGHASLLKNEAGIWLVSDDPEGEVRISKGSLENYTFFTIWDYSIVAAYLLLTLYVGLRYSGKHKTTATYFKGDGKIPAWAVGFSILGAQISAISFMSTPAKVYATNWNYFLLSIAVILVIPVINRYFIPFYRRLDITSAYEYLDKRFNYLMRFIASLLYILFELGRLAIIMILPSLALSVVTGIDVNLCVLLMGLITLVYTFKGGIKAVIWTDVMQVFVLFGGSLLCIIYILFFLPASFHELSQNIIVNQKFKLIDHQVNLSTPNLWVVLIGGWTLSFLPYSTDQTTVQRYLTTKNEKDARKSVRVSAWISIPATVIFMGIGTLVYLFYYYHPAEVNITHHSQDSIFPWYIVSQLPSGIRGLLVAGIFAATMSSLSSSLTSASTAFITDFYSVMFSQKTQRKYLQAARLTTLSVGVLSILIALYIINKGVVSLWDQYNIFMGLFTGGIGGVFCLGIFTTRANAAGAIGGLIISGVVQYLISRYTNIHFLLYATIGIVSCFIFGMLISLLFKGSEKNLDGLTIYTQIHKEDNL